MQYISEVYAERKESVLQTSTDVFLFIPRSLWRTIYVSGNTDLAYQYSYCRNHVSQRLNDVPWWGSLSVFVLFASLGWLLFQKKVEIHEKYGLQMILMFFISVFIGIFIYGIIFRGDLFDHYLGTLFPIFIMAAAYGLSKFINNKKLIICLLLIFAVSNLQLLFMSHHRFGFNDKIRAVDWTVSTLSNKEFSLDVLGDCFKYNGYRYLFYLRGKEPAKSYVDANFTYLYDKPPSTTHPPYLVVFTNPDWVESESYYNEYLRYKQKLITSAQFGRIEILVVDNRNLDFVGKF